MKVKNVINGLLKEYALEEITIIDTSEDKVVFSGTVEQWQKTNVDMIDCKHKVESMEVAKRLMFNSRKGFLFI